MKKIICISFLGIALAVSCAKQDVETAAADSNAIRFVTNIATKASGTAFEAGDQMSIWAVEQDGAEKMPLQIGGNFINNACLSFDGLDWNADQNYYWGDKPCDFYALYPYVENITSVENQACVLPLDQNAPETETSLSGFEAADVMFALNEGAVKTGGAVALNFHHMLTKCSVNIIKGPQFEGDIPDDIVVHIYNTVSAYKLNLTKGSVGVSPLGERKTITMRKLDNLHFDAIVVPQKIELETPLIEITMGGIAYLLNSSVVFKPGYNHTFNLTLNTSPDQEKWEIKIDAGQEGWN